MAKKFLAGLRIYATLGISIFILMPTARGEIIRRHGPDSLKDKLDSLRTARETRINELGRIDKQLENLSAAIELESVRRAGISIETKTIQSANIKAKASNDSEVMGKVPKDSRAVVIGAEGSWFKVVCDGIEGYVIYFELDINEALRSLLMASRAEYNTPENKELREKAKQEKLAEESAKKMQRALAARWVRANKANVRKGPSEKADLMGSIEIGGKVYLEERQGDWGRVTVPQETILRYMSVNMETRDSCWIYLPLLSENEVFRPAAEEIRAENTRQAYCRDHPEISDEFRRAILGGKIMIGMTKDMVAASWGDPNDINRTVNKYLVSEQWIYGDLYARIYVYIENGIVTAWQD